MKYEIKFQNQKVWEFFEKHKQLNVESTTVAFIDIMEMLMNHTNPALNTELASKLLQNVQSMTSQIHRIQKRIHRRYQTITK